MCWYNTYHLSTQSAQDGYAKLCLTLGPPKTFMYNTSSLCKNDTKGQIQPNIPSAVHSSHTIAQNVNRFGLTFNQTEIWANLNVTANSELNCLSPSEIYVLPNQYSILYQPCLVLVSMYIERT